MREFIDPKLINLMVSENRLERFDLVSKNRIKNLTAVYDRISDPHNVSACIRSAENFGLSEVYFLTPEKFKGNRKVTANADQWITVNQFQESSELLGELKSKGYTLAAAVPLRSAIDFQEIAVPEKLAVIFGAEKWGISEEMVSQCEYLITIPSVGFTESLNISTANAIMLQYFSREFRKCTDNILTPAEREKLKENWIRREIIQKTRGNLDPLLR